MSKFSLSSLRSRAITLVLLAIFPLLALTLYSYFDQRDRAIREVQRDELVAARNLATIQETVISDARQLLATLARLPQVQRRDRDACNALFAELLKQSPHYARPSAPRILRAGCSPALLPPPARSIIRTVSGFRKLPRPGTW